MGNLKSNKTKEEWDDLVNKTESHSDQVIGKMNIDKFIEEAAERLHPEEWDWREREIFIAGAKWMQERMYSEENMISFAEFVATYLDKNRNVNGEMLHAKSKYDGAERTIDLLKQYKK